MDFIAAFTFDILIDDCIFTEKYSKMILDFKQLSRINLKIIFNRRNFKIFFKKRRIFKSYVVYLNYEIKNFIAIFSFLTNKNYLIEILYFNF